MLDRIQQFFNQRIADQAPLDDAARLRIATCALLLEAAHADRDFSARERQLVADLVARRFGLDQADAEDLLALAEQERLGADDLFQFTRLVDADFPRARKLAVIELMWRVVYSDGVLEAHEDALMRKVAKLLGVRPDELIALKLKVKGDGG
ncbi:MAG: TerB family tellurite resistance protein [Krumholzibacteria bacterium]|nr:TerB family tellurite resistance protein [Candidatus Krumholzibacteria bacterium]